jgi:hypothetical protein
MADDVVARLRAFEAQVEQHVQAILAAARACPPGGNNAWDGVLRHYGGVPESPVQRLEVVAELKLKRGAIPGEVNQALAAVEKWAKGELEAQARSDWWDWQPAIELRQRLQGMAAQRTESYKVEVMPRAGGVASVFANARETADMVPWKGLKFDAVRVRSCAACGAPQEIPLDFVCRYCRASMTG